MTLTRRAALWGMAATPLVLAASRAHGYAGDAISPGEDFYAHVNAAALEGMTIPAGRSDYGQFDIVGAQVTARVEALVAEAVERPVPRSAGEARVVAAYRSVLDDGAAERGLPRLKHSLSRILAARSHREIGRLMTDPRSSSLVAFNVFPAQGEWMVSIDQQNQNQPMLGLSGAIYAGTDARAQGIREAYRACIADLLALAGVGDSARRAADVVAIETAIAARMWSPERLRDRRANLHVMPPAELSTYAPGLPWREMLRARGLADVARINLGTDSAVAAQARLFAETPVDMWRSWLAFTWIRNAIAVMPTAFRDRYWRFTADVRGGDARRPSREQEAARFVNTRLPMEIGALYVAAEFTEDARDRAREMLTYLKRAMAERLRSADWLDPASRAEALAKLDAMALKAGYPAATPPQAEIALDPADPSGNLDALLARDWQVQRLRLTSPETRAELWYQTPQTVGASYSVLLNAIEVPAAILQPPFFAADGDPAANFGAIGAIIGHEIGHGFDDQGLLYDSKGILREWMSPAATAGFAARAERLAAQYGAFEPLPGLKLDGRRTIGETIADLSGLSLALRALQLHRVDHPVPGSDERVATRALFRSWARAWLYKAQDSAIRQIVASSYHAPARYRVNGVVRNIDAWYDAFDVVPGDALYLAPAERVRLW
ncbi:M13 family metallopeptidase [Sphingomonas sp. HF-S3]|uniref:M13 family metallopeptidase n=1 Tax=Sphingomonas rustica TaxID=3103142 RepID=A0ABV0BBI4_9SPHN